MTEFIDLIDSQVAILDAARSQLLILRQQEEQRRQVLDKMSGQDWERVPLFLKMTEAAKLLSVGYATMQELSRQPGFPGIKIGNEWRIDSRKLRDWLLDHITTDNFR